MPILDQQSILDLPAPSTYVRLLLRQAPQQADALLGGSGVDTATLGHSDTLSVAQVVKIFANGFAAAANPEWGLAFGRRLNIASHGALGFAAISAPTLGEGLEVLAAFGRIRAPYFEFRAEPEQAHFRLILRPLLPLGPLETAMQETVLVIAESFVRVVLGEDSREGTACLNWPAPAYAASYRDYFNGQVRFDCPVAAYEVPAALCRLPCPLHDRQTYLASLARCREALAVLIDPSDASTRARQLLEAHYERLVAGTADAVQPRFEAIAAQLHLSPRTLARRLSAQGSGFRELLEAAQREAACRMLGEARYTVHEVGERLGYADAANFGRAFRRWTGVAPGQYRRRAPGNRN